jgi:5-methylcytosine-specific restriction enzyme A
MIGTWPIQEFLRRRFGFEIDVDTEDSEKGQLLVIRPANMDSTICFKVEIIVGWRSIEAKFIPDNYAAELLAAMENATADQKAAFVTFASSIIQKGAGLRMTFGHLQADPLHPSEWPSQWSDFEISMEKIGLVLGQGEANDSKQTLPWIASFFGAALALLPLEPVSDAEIPIGEAEGQVYYAIVKKYERSRINRAACLEVHGTKCKTCHVELGEEYGSIAEGLIHIHHLIPVSMLGEGYVIDPAKDLVPVCPNCHAVIHQHYPPLDLESVRQALGRQEHDGRSD